MAQTGIDRKAAELISDEAAEIESSEEDEGLGADELIKQFRKIRTKLEAMDAAHDEACKPYKEAMGLIKDELKRILDEAGADSVKTEFGTAYKSIKTNVKMDDKDAFIRSILEQVPQLDEAFIDHIRGLIDISMDVKPSKQYVEDFISDYNDLPAGVQVSRYIDINVRK